MESYLMKVQVINEAGYEEAIYAMSLSYFDESQEVSIWWDNQRDKAVKRAAKMAQQDSGHNDFLTMTSVWLEIVAPLYMWKQLDRYQIGFRKLSTSTMHTLIKTGVTADRFEYVPKFFNIDEFNEWLKTKPDIEEVANELPDGFLQRRVVKTNYKTLRNIIYQRNGHRLKSWQVFVDAIYKQVAHPELLPNNI